MRGYTAYRESGLEWLGRIPADWAVKRLRFACQVNPSKMEVGLLPNTTQVSFLPMESIGETGELSLDHTRPLGDVREGYTHFRDGDIVVAKITPCFENGKGALCDGLIGGIGFGTTELHVLRPNCDLNARYVFYVTRSHRFRDVGVAMMKGSAGQQRVPDEFIKDYPLLIPPRAEQDAIVAYLDGALAEIDRFIAAKTRLIAFLRERKAAIINRAVTRGLDAAAPTRASGIPWLGDVPAHWEVKRAKYLFTSMEQGWSPQCEARPKNETEWGVLKVGCVNGYTFNESEHKALPANVEPVVEYEIQPGDVLVSRANTLELLGGAACVEHVMPRLLLCDKLYRIRLHESAMSPFFFVRLLQSSPSRMQVERGASGASASMQNIGQDVIQNLWIAFPPPQEQKRILKHIESRTLEIDSAVRRAEREIALMREYRTALISEVVTGKVDVRGAGKEGTERAERARAGARLALQG